MNRRAFLGLALAAATAPAFAANSSTKRHILSFHHQHTGEKLRLCYRIGENYQRSALQRINHFLRDFRTDDIIPIDPKLLDLLHEVQQQVGNKDAVYEVLSGYRSPRTNAMLRARSSRVAKHSLHLTGQAIDIRLSNTRSPLVRDIAIDLGRGGVGYYQHSDFVHLDTGPVRRWRA